MKRVYLVLLVTLFLVSMSLSAYAQFIGYPQYYDFSNNGGGARAAGMGNAYMGISDDEMAYSWNPAGMIFVDKAKLGVQFQSKADRFDMPYNLAIDSLGDIISRDTRISRNHFNLNFTGFAIPFNFINRDWYVGGGYRNLYDMKLKYDAPGKYPGTMNSWTSNGGMDAISFALAGKIIEGFGIGVIFAIL